MILIPTKGPDDWKHLLADPDLHWEAGYSAYALAHRWEEAKGFPSEIKEALESVPALEDVELLLAIVVEPLDAALDHTLWHVHTTPLGDEKASHDNGGRVRAASLMKTAEPTPTAVR